MNKPKILIGVPVFADMPVESFISFTRWFYHLGRRMTEYTFDLYVIPRRSQGRAKNAILLQARTGDYSHVLVLDDDMMPDVDIDWLRVLLAHDKDVIGALYFQRGGGYRPVVMKFVTRKEEGGKIVGADFLKVSELEDGLQQVDVIGGGCHLIKTSVLNKIIEPYYYEDGFVGQDCYFCRKLWEAGIKVYLDSSLYLGHVQMSREIIDGLRGRALAEAIERQQSLQDRDRGKSAVQDVVKVDEALARHKERPRLDDTVVEQSR